MPPYNDNFRDFSHAGFNTSVEKEGLRRFTKNLEKHFFSQVTIRNCSHTKDVIKLVIELDCNFGLLEALHHFEKNAWGNFESLESSFSGALSTLKENSNLQIKVEEFSLFFKDTSIIINSIYDLSIAQQLKNIFSQLSEHTVHFTKGLSAIPYEIYIPVFEDDVIEDENTLLMDIRSGNKNGQDYYSFWGLYYYSEDDALVYDLKNQTIIKGKLQMLNR